MIVMIMIIRFVLIFFIDIKVLIGKNLELKCFAKDFFKSQLIQINLYNLEYFNLDL